VTLLGASSRQESQIKNLEHGFLIGGLVMLALTMGMAAKFGWALGNDEMSKWGSAVFYAGADFIGALLMASVGVLFAWRWYSAGVLVLLATAGCIAFSMVTIFGFQSSNRTAVTLNYEAKQRQADKRLDWLRGMTVDKGMTKDRQTLLDEERSQYKSMQEQQADPDAQASELATMLGIGKDAAQRRLNILASIFILFLQFTCLSLRSFLRHRVAPSVSALTHGPLAPNTDGQLHNTVVQVSRTDAENDVRALVGKNIELCNEELAERWRVDQSKASRWTTEFSRAGICRRVQRGRRKVIVAPLRTVKVTA